MVASSRDLSGPEAHWDREAAPKSPFLRPTPLVGEHWVQWEGAASIGHEALPCARHRQLQHPDHGGASPGLSPQLQRHLLAGHSQALLPLVWKGTLCTDHLIHTWGSGARWRWGQCTEDADLKSSLGQAGKGVGGEAMVSPLEPGVSYNATGRPGSPQARARPGPGCLPSFLP